MTTTSAIDALPPFEAALETFVALMHEGYDVQTALTVTWDEYEALIAQREKYMKGVRA
jgi:hypothetical protein